MFDFDKDELLVCAYIHPEGSSLYEKFNTEDNNGITIMEGEILHIFGQLGKIPSLVVTCGLNARTGHLQDYVIDDSIYQWRTGILKIIFA